MKPLDIIGLLSLLDSQFIRKKIGLLGTSDFWIRKGNPRIWLESPDLKRAQILTYNNGTYDYGFEIRYGDMTFRLDTATGELKFMNPVKGVDDVILNRKNIGEQNLKLTTNAIPSVDLAISSDPTKTARFNLNKSASVDYGPQLTYDNMRFQLDPATRQPNYWDGNNKYEMLHKGNSSHPNYSDSGSVTGCWIYTTDNFPLLLDDGLWHRLNYNLVFRNNSGWSYMDFQFVPPRNGLYHVEARATWLNATQGSRMALRINNATGNLTTLADTRTYYNDQYCISGSTILWLSEGERIWIEYLCDGTDGKLVNTSASTNVKIVQLN